MENNMRRRLRHRSQIVWPEGSRAGETGAYERTNIGDLTDDLLELVLLRIRSPVCLVRATATCKLWRRVVAGAGFLRRFGSLHAPPVLGHFYAGYYKTVFVPAPMQPGEALVDVRRDVSLEFLSRVPNYVDSDLDLIDSRGGLLAFATSSFDGLVVCNPLARQCRELRSPPAWGDDCSLRLGFFLLDADSDDMGTKPHMSNFRVLHVRMGQKFLNVRYCDRSATFRASVFSTRNNAWLQLSSTAVGDVVPAAVRADIFEFVGRAGGYLCWSFKGGNVLHLHESTGEFSWFTLPTPAEAWRQPFYCRFNLRVVGTDTSTVRLVRVLGSYLEVLTLAHGGCAECLVERRVSLSQLLARTEPRPSPDWSWSFLKAAAVATSGHVVLLPDREYMWMFSLDVATMKLERVQKTGYHADRAFQYELPWPPTINACV